MDRDRLKVLLDLYVDEGLNADTKQELEQILLAEPHARELFWEKIRLNTMLRQLGQESWGREQLPALSIVPTTETQAASNRVFPWNKLAVLGLSIAAILAMLMLGVWMPKDDRLSALPVDAGPRVAKVSHTERPVWVAILREAIDVHWIDEANAPSVGEAMTARRLRFESGIVEIQTNRGALITLKGPADLDVISGMEVNCRSGELRVNVPPPAHGFLVHTPSINVVDRGTSFSMNVRDDKRTEVHVIEGMVELVSREAEIPMRELHEGQSVDVMAGVYRVIPNNKVFKTDEKMLSHRKASNDHSVDAWRRRRDAIANDESCFLYFDFEGAEQNDLELVNRAANAAPSTNGTIVGCDWADGRWPGKRALEFKNLFDRVLVNVPGKHETLSCVVSVRVDAMDSWSSSLLTNLDPPTGGFRWHLSPGSDDPSAGRLGLRSHNQKNNGILDQYASDSIVRPEQFGTWMQVAFVWDSSEGIFRQYVDGKLVSSDGLRSIGGIPSALVALSHLEIGNGTLGDQDGDVSVRSFSGRIDEFAMFDRALSSQEILLLHDLDRMTWKGSDDDAEWGEEWNWVLGLKPSVGDIVYIDRKGKSHAHFQQGKSQSFSALRVGSDSDSTGELEITGGTLIADRHSSSSTRIGVAGGHGSTDQSGGKVILNTLQIGLDQGSHGTYKISGGDLIVRRGVSETVGSIEVGAKLGVGRFEVSGGSIATRVGVTLGRDDGVGNWCVYGSKADHINIGSIEDKNGFWVQNKGSSLTAFVDQNGLTAIHISKSEKISDDQDSEQKRGDVIFRAGAILDVDFAEMPQAGSWDVMKWEGKLMDEGLRFADQVDENVWSFEFVDSDQSGTEDTLRVIASPQS